MKILSILIILCFLCGIVWGDEFIITRSCYPKEMQKKFKDVGLKLDLSGNNRTKDSWGFLVNRGSEYSIYTYLPADEKDFTIIKNIVLEKPND